MKIILDEEEYLRLKDRASSVPSTPVPCPPEYGSFDWASERGNPRRTERGWDYDVDSEGQE